MAVATRVDLGPVDVGRLDFRAEDVPPPAPEGPPAFGLCANQPNGGPYDPEAPSTRARDTRAMADTALLWPLGKELLVYFLNGTDAWGQAIRQAVREIAPTWSDYANIRFRFDDPTSAHITVNLIPGPGGASYGTYSSFLGTDCRAVMAQPRPIPSMNLVFHPSLQANRDFMRSEFHRVILHEFGHALGFIHEHMRPDRPIRWDVPALNRYCSRNFGWNAQTVQQQIIDEYVPRGVGSMKGGGFDPDSIMMYQYPAGVATYADGRPFVTPNNVALTAMDKVVASMVYPATGVVDPDEQSLVPGDPPRPGSIASAGQVARYRFVPTRPGNYAVETRGDTPLLVSILTRRKDPAGRMLAAEGANARITFSPSQVDKDYFVEVRHAKPMRGTGAFAISVRPPA